jgi:prepilin-type N-terminal cleavage/methylation domain-containing protein
MRVGFSHLFEAVRRSRVRPRSGFSFVEMLVVIAIIVILATLLLPVVNNVRESANRSRCASNLREIGKAARAFAKDHQDAGTEQKGGRTIDNAGNATAVQVQTTTSVLAADTVFFSGGPQFQWSIAGVYRINHVQSGNPKLPDFQNLLYSDGSVAAHGREDYSQPLNIDPIGSTGNGTPGDTGPNWSMLMSNSSGVGGYLYWGPGEALPLPIPPTTLPATNPGNNQWGTAVNQNIKVTTPPPPPPPPTAVPMPVVFIPGK